MNIVRRAVLISPLAALVLCELADAQLVLEKDAYNLTLEGFANVTGGRDLGTDNLDAGSYGARLDGAIRWIGLVKGGGSTSFGPRIVVQTSPQNKLDLGEGSLLLLKRWGRIEVGYRQGLPDVLLGYAPNNFTFTGAEFGPATGPGLDPDGRLPTAFLDPQIARQIDALSYLGFAARLYGDQSAKIIFVPAKRGGFLGGLSFAPNVESKNGPVKQLVQTGVTYERYSESTIFRAGMSYTYGHGDRSPTAVTGDVHSMSGGATVVLHDRLALGASLTFDGRSGLQRRPGEAFFSTASTAFGWSASANYNLGPWTLGAYYQTAAAEGDTAGPGRDHLRVVHVGGSYRFNPRARLYAAAFFYRFSNEGGRQASDRFGGAVAVLGARLTL